MAGWRETPKFAAQTHPPSSAEYSIGAEVANRS